MAPLRLCVSAAVCSVACVPSPASTAPLSPSQASAQSRSPDEALEPIIVTARRRQEELERTPVSVVSLSARELEARSLTNLRALQNFVPNLTFAPSQNVGDAAGNIFIRGIGQEDFLAGTESGVGLYLDGVYVARTMGNLIDLIDVDRIEVLRGPQGTLYGKNTVGGAINVISAQPAAEVERRAGLIFGDLGRFEARATVNQPLSDTLFVRGSGGWISRDGYLKRLPPPFPPTAVTETDHRAEGSADIVAGRLQIRWEAAPSLTIDLAADASRRRGTQGATHVDAIDPVASIFPDVNTLIRQGRLPGPELTGNVLVTDDRLASYAGGSNLISQDTHGGAVTVARRFGRHDVKLMASYRHLRSHVSTDLDGSWFAILQGDFAERHRQYSVELQANGTLGPLDYTAGLFGLDERMNTGSARGSGRIDVLLLCGCFYGPGNFPTPFQVRRWQGGRNYAAYAQANVRLADRLSATLGARLSHERKSTRAQLIQLERQTLELTDIVLRTGSNSGHWNSFTWRAGLEFQARPDLMLYVSAAKGYKSGGFNSRPAPSLPNLGINRFAPETAITYEAGLRSQWFGDRFRLNATLFHTDYRDIQLRRQTFFGGMPTTLIENAARARVRGVEIEGVAKLAPRLTGSVAYGHLAPRYLDVGTVEDLTPNTAFQRSPRNSFTASLDYVIPVTGRGLALHGDYSYRSHEQFQLLPSPFDQPGYGLLGARLTLRDDGDRWSVALFGTNLADKRYRSAGRDGLQAVGIANSVMGLPREIGIELRAGF